jgi:hypothetical protein
MTLTEILEQAKNLSPHELDELLIQLQALQIAPSSYPTSKTGAEIVTYLEAMDSPIDLVDSHIIDPVEWIKAQRNKRQGKLQSNKNGE